MVMNNTMINNNSNINDTINTQNEDDYGCGEAVLTNN